MAETQTQIEGELTQLSVLRSYCLQARQAAEEGRLKDANQYLDKAGEIHSAIYFSLNLPTRDLSKEDFRTLRLINASALEAYELAESIVGGSK